MPERTTLIESLGVYLPEGELSTDEVVRGCRNKLRFPLERLTGIKSRRVVAEGEYALDLASRAVERCLALSQYVARDVDLLISAAIARVDGPGFRVACEPSTAVRLKHRFGFDNALAFDVRSACSGMWVGIAIADALLARGLIQRALIVSGEYISHLVATAQLEIDGFLDDRIACLTLGDSGAAVLLHAGYGGRGFAAVSLCTLGDYADCCVARPTQQSHGGAIMNTDALRLTDAAARFGSDHALETLRVAGWASEAFDHLIMHQTSRTALSGAVSAINRRMRSAICHEGNTINNLGRRGNTATTTHFVALADAIAAGRIRSGERIIFSISGGGLTLGTALYTLDDLPYRMQEAAQAPARAAAFPEVAGPDTVRVGVTAIGTAPRDGSALDTVPALELAARACLTDAGMSADAVDLIIFAGVYRTGFINEPAVAAFLADAIGANSASFRNGSRTLAFDISNGTTGVLDACRIAAEIMAAGRARAALVVASEVENNAAYPGARLLGLEPAASAMLLQPVAADAPHFGPVLRRSYGEHLAAFESHWVNESGRPILVIDKVSDLERRYIYAAVETVREFLDQQDLRVEDVACFLAPQSSRTVISGLAAGIGAPPERFIDVVRDERDLATSSLAFTLREARDRGILKRRQMALIIAVGAGIEAGCALYHG